MEEQLENFPHVFYKSLIRRLSLRNSPSRVLKTGLFGAQTTHPSRLRICKKRGKILMLFFQSFIYFLSYTRCLECGQFKIEKFKWACMEDYYSSKFQFHVIELSKIETTKGKESKNFTDGEINFS